LLTGSATELTTEPRTLVTGSVTAWMPLDTPEVSPESNDGWLTVAASACCAGRDSSKQIPPPAIPNRATRRMTRCVFGFDMTTPSRRELSPAMLMPGRGVPGVSQATVADERSVRSPPYKCMGLNGYRSPEHLPWANASR